MIHNRLKFTLAATGFSWLRGRILNWRLSQPGFDPSYGKLVCLATLMSSDRTKQICLWMTIYICVVCVCVRVFIQYTNRRIRTFVSLIKQDVFRKKENKMNYFSGKMCFSIKFKFQEGPVSSRKYISA